MGTSQHEHKTWMGIDTGWSIHAIGSRDRTLLKRLDGDFPLHLGQKRRSKDESKQTHYRYDQSNGYYKDDEQDSLDDRVFPHSGVLCCRIPDTLLAHSRPSSAKLMNKYCVLYNHSCCAHRALLWQKAPAPRDGDSPTYLLLARCSPDKRSGRGDGASGLQSGQYLPGLSMGKQGEACRTGDVRQSDAHGRLTFIVNQLFRLVDPARMVRHEVECCRIPEADDTRYMYN